MDSKLFPLKKHQKDMIYYFKQCQNITNLTHPETFILFYNSKSKDKI